MLLTKRHLPRRTMLKGMGAAIALPLLDAMVPAGIALAKTLPSKKRLIAMEMVHGAAGSTTFGASQASVGAGAAGPRVRPVADLDGAARGVPRLPDDCQQHRRQQRRGVHRARDRRRPLPLGGGVPDAVASQADPGLRPARRHLDRPDRGAEDRPRDAHPVDAAVHRERRSGRRLLLRLLVRLHRLDQLGLADRAAADDPRPAAGLRPAVRHRRHARSAGRAAPQGPQPARLRAGLGGPSAEGPGRLGSGAPVGLPRRRARDRAPHPEGRRDQLERRAAGAARRAEGRARLLRRARQADDGPAGAGLPVGPDARVRLQAEPRRQQPRVHPRREHRLPHRLAPRRTRRPHPRLRQDQPLPRRTSCRTCSRS